MTSATVTEREKKPLSAFLCYATMDKPTVRNLCKSLVAEGIDVWFDENNLLPGDDWEEEISDAVRTSDVVIVCLSKGSITKEGYVQKEMKLILDMVDKKPEGKVYLIPAKLEECNVPHRLSRWQWVDLHSPKGYEKLRLALFNHAKELGISLRKRKTADTVPHGPIGYLIVRDGDERGKVYKISGRSARIGRRYGEIILADSKVSSTHAKLAFLNNHWTIFDFDSANGTFVNDKRIEIDAVINENDVIKIGDTIMVFKELL